MATPQQHLPFRSFRLPVLRWQCNYDILVSNRLTSSHHTQPGVVADLISSPEAVTSIDNRQSQVTSDGDRQQYLRSPTTDTGCRYSAMVSV